MSNIQHTFLRAERLKSHKVITRLFNKEGRSFSCYPLRLVWSEIEPLSAVSLQQSAFSNVSSAISHLAGEIDNPSSLSNKSLGEKEDNAPDFPVQFALSVSKRTFKRAHDRNLMRRRIREAYRLHKHELYIMLKKSAFAAHSHKQFAFMVLYVAKEELPFSEIEAGIKKMIYKFGKELNNLT